MKMEYVAVLMLGIWIGMAVSAILNMAKEN